MTQSTLIKEGQTFAANMLEADTKASMTKQTLILKLANKYAGKKEQFAMIIDATKEVFIASGLTSNTVNVRISEYKLVHSIIGLTEVTNDNYNELAGLNKGYNALITLAREIKNRGKVKSTTPAKVMPLTDTGLANTIVNVNKADVKQVDAIVNQASAQIINLFDDKDAQATQQIILINSIIGNMDKVEHSDFVKGFINEVGKLTTQALVQLQQGEEVKVTA